MVDVTRFYPSPHDNTRYWIGIHRPTLLNTNNIYLLSRRKHQRDIGSAVIPPRRYTIESNSHRAAKCAQTSIRVISTITGILSCSPGYNEDHHHIKSTNTFLDFRSTGKHRPRAWGESDGNALSPVVRMRQVKKTMNHFGQRLRIWRLGGASGGPLRYMVSHLSTDPLSAT